MTKPNEEMANGITEDLTTLLNEVDGEDQCEDHDEKNNFEQSLILSDLAKQLNAVIVRTANENHELRQRVGVLEECDKEKDQIIHGVLGRIADLERNSIIDLKTGIYTDRYLSRAADNFSAQFHRHDVSFGVIGINVESVCVETLQEQNDFHVLADEIGTSFRGYDQVIFSREKGFFTILLDRIMHQDQMKSIAERIDIGINNIYKQSFPMGAFLMQAGQERDEKGNVVHTAIRGMRQSLQMWHEGGEVAILLNGA